MKKLSFCIITLFCLCLAVVSCKEAAENTLDKALKEVRSELPKDMGNDMKITAVDLETDFLTMKMECPDMVVAALELVGKDEMKSNFVEGFKGQGDNNDFIDLCIMAKKGLKIRIIGNEGNASEYDLEIPYDEISQLKN